MQNKRIFLAVNIPAELKEEIGEKFLKKLDVKGLKPVAKENLHFTVKFLGYLPEEGVEELGERLKGLGEFKKFQVEIEGIGEFKNRVIWLGVKKGEEELRELNERVNELLGLEKERFSSHLTIARNKFLQVEKLKEILEELKEVEFRGEFVAESLDLMESKLTPSGAEYFVLRRIEFA